MPAASSPARSLSAMPSTHSSVSTWWLVRSQSTEGTAKSGSSRVFSAISDSAAASSRRSISMATERDSVSTISIERSRRASADQDSAVRAANISEPRSRRKRSAIWGRSTLTATAWRTPSRLDLGAVHLGDGGRRHRGPEAREGLRQRPFQRRRDHGFGLRLRERRHPVLQPFEIARHGDADHVGAGRQHLAELDIGRSEPRQRARQPRPAGDVAPLDQPRQPQQRAAPAPAAAPDRRWRRRPRAQRRCRATEAQRRGRSRKSQTPARMQRDDAAGHGCR